MGFALPKFVYSGPGVHFPARYYLLVVLLILLAHFLFSHLHEEYSKATSLTQLAPWIQSHSASTQCVGADTDTESVWGTLEGDQYPRAVHKPQIGRANATFVILARNHEINDIVQSLAEMEHTFNHQYHYPYVFLNDLPFTAEFKERTSKVVSGKVSYGQIPHDHWHQPPTIDEERARKSREDMVRNDVIYGGSVSYRNMCRFNSGFFFRHELLQQYRYYWRIEPGVNFFCDITEDPFVFLQENNKVYGFTISMYEYESTIPTLWETTKEFIRKHPEYVAKDNALKFISDDRGDSYNMCHFWSNFEIADMDFWRSEAYMKYFEFLDSKGGFYYERWGDAPVHSIGAALFAKKEQIHFFKEIGYRHNPFQHCPQGALHTKGKCWCDERNNFDYESYSCTTRFERML